MKFKIKSIYILFVLSALVSSCNKNKTLFQPVSSDHSGIHFNNSIPDNDSFNIMKYQNVYNGGGVGIGDFNNDGLQDIYFTGNMVSNKLYLNKGGFSFQDITTEADVAGNGEWCRGWRSWILTTMDGWISTCVQR